MFQNSIVSRRITVKGRILTIARVKLARFRQRFISHVLVDAIPGCLAELCADLGNDMRGDKAPLQSAGLKRGASQDPVEEPACEIISGPGRVNRFHRKGRGKK